MRVLPPQIQPPESPTRRRHKPEPLQHWSAYRSCLRWDFGFTCSFCLLHECDFFGEIGGEGLGVTTAEHRIPRSVDSDREAEYSNCIYACRLCNRARSYRPVVQQGHRLLDPTMGAWAEHFKMSGDELRPVADDSDAAYTHKAYDLDDPRKVARRELRRLVIEDRLRLLAGLEDEILALVDLADNLRNRDLQLFLRAVQGIKKLREHANRALTDFVRFLAVPRDAPSSCRCGTVENHLLPRWLADQVLNITEPAAS